MNNTEKRAEALAQAAELVRKANESGHNLEGIAELLQYNHPEEIVDDLLKAYFELSQFITNAREDCSCMGSSLYTLREVYWAFAKMLKPTETPIVLKVGDLSNNA